MTRPLAAHLEPAERAAALELRLRDTWASIDTVAGALETFDTARGWRNQDHAAGELRRAIASLLELRNRPIARRHRTGSTGSPDPMTTRR